MTATERDPWKRVHFALQQTTLDADAVVVLDEFGANLDLAPTHGWAPVGERVRSTAPRTTPSTTTTLASMTAHGMGPAMIMLGGMTQAAFESYLEQVLGPTLHPGQIVVVDNLRAHKSLRAVEILAERECQLVYLPPYSSDYAPIELAFAKIKTAWRRAAARTRADLETAIATALTQITAAEARAFFLHCGYHFLPNLDQWFCT